MLKSSFRITVIPKLDGERGGDECLGRREFEHLK